MTNRVIKCFKFKKKKKKRFGLNTDLIDAYFTAITNLFHCRRKIELHRVIHSRYTRIKRMFSMYNMVFGPKFLLFLRVHTVTVSKYRTKPPISMM